MISKTILVTGVSRGIGKAVAERFLKNGDFVIGSSTSGTIDWQNKNLVVFQLDLSKSDSIKTFVHSVKNLKRNIDVLINSAAIWDGIEEDPTLDPGRMRKVFEVNVIGTADLTEQLLPFISQGGHIINISSRSGSMDYTSHPFYPAYKMSKSALNMLTRMLSFRLKGKVIVSSLHPGWVKTDMGGYDADLEPEEAAEDIFELANANVETGQFWFKGKKFPW